MHYSSRDHVRISKDYYRYYERVSRDYKRVSRYYEWAVWIMSGLLLSVGITSRVVHL